jgi:CRP-like cAMP-binding protein
MIKPLNNSLFSYLNQLQPLSDQTIQALLLVAKRNHYAEGQQLLAVGQICEQVYLIEKGSVRAYFIDECQKDITSWLVIENQVFTQPHSLFDHNPSTDTLEVLESSIIWQIDIRDLNRLQQSHPDLVLLGLALNQKYFVLYEERAKYLCGTSNQQRYLTFIKNYPTLLQRIPLKYIATFLGMTPSTLSHVRRQLMENEKTPRLNKNGGVIY